MLDASFNPLFAANVRFRFYGNAAKPQFIFEELTHTLYFDDRLGTHRGPEHRSQSSSMILPYARCHSSWTDLPMFDFIRLIVAELFNYGRAPFFHERVPDHRRRRDGNRSVTRGTYAMGTSGTT